MSFHVVLVLPSCGLPLFVWMDPPSTAADGQESSEAGQRNSSNSQSSPHVGPDAAPATVLFRVEGVRCVATRGGSGARRRDVASGELLVMQVASSELPPSDHAAETSDTSKLVFLMLGPFSYPLVGQAILRVDTCHWVLPSDTEGEAWGVIVDEWDCDSTGNDATHAQQARAAVVRGFDSLLRRYCTVHDHTTHEIVAYDPRSDPTVSHTGAATQAVPTGSDALSVVTSAGEARDASVSGSAAALGSAMELGSAWLASSLVAGASLASSGLAWYVSWAVLVDLS